jgi:hypothetical protein
MLDSGGLHPDDMAAGHRQVSFISSLVFLALAGAWLSAGCRSPLLCPHALKLAVPLPPEQHPGLVFLPPIVWRDQRVSHGRKVACVHSALRPGDGRTVFGIELFSEQPIIKTKTADSDTSAVCFEAQRTALAPVPAMPAATVFTPT